MCSRGSFLDVIGSVMHTGPELTLRTVNNSLCGKIVRAETLTITHGLGGEMHSSFSSLALKRGEIAVIRTIGNSTPHIAKEFFSRID